MRTLLTLLLLLPGMALAQQPDDWVREPAPATAHPPVQPARVQSQPVQQPEPVDMSTQPLIATNPQQPIPPERVPRAVARTPMRAQPTYAQQQDFPPQPQQPLVASTDDTDDPDAVPQAVATMSALAACPPIDLPVPNWTGAIIYSMNPQKEQCIPCQNLDKMLASAGCTLGTFKRNPGANFIHVYLRNKDAFVRRNVVEAPTVIFFVNGEESGRQSGFTGTQEEIKSIIAKHPASRAVRQAKALLRSVGETDDVDYPPAPNDDRGFYADRRSSDDVGRWRRDMDLWEGDFAARRLGGTQSSYRNGGTQSAYRYGGTQSAYRYGGTQSSYYGGTQSSYPAVSYSLPVQTFYANDSNLVSSSVVYPQSYGSGTMVCNGNGCQFVR